MAEKVITQPPIAGLTPPNPKQTPLDTERRLSFNQAHTIVDSGEGFYIPIDGWDRMLSPMESGTDVPLPIIAYDQPPAKSKASRHHGYYFKRHYMRGDASIRALRHSRLQRVNFSAHEAYHQNYFGTITPSSVPTAARGILLNTAGYVPSAAVIIRGDDVSIRELTEQERNRLRRQNAFTSEQTRKIGDFLMNYALEQRLDHVKQAQIEEFLSLTPRRISRSERLKDRKLRLGLRLTNIAISVAVDPVEFEYRVARHNLSLRTDTPNTAWHLVKNLVRGREQKSLDILENRLLDEFGAVA